MIAKTAEQRSIGQVRGREWAKQWATQSGHLRVSRDSDPDVRQGAADHLGWAVAVYQYLFVKADDDAELPAFGGVGRSDRRIAIHQGIP